MRGHGAAVTDADPARGAIAPPPRATLQTVDRALGVLSSFAAPRSDWGVTELARELRLDKSTAQRLLGTLAARGFLHRDPTTHRYRLGAAVWHIASTWERRGGMATLLHPILAGLAERTARNAVFALADGAHVRCVAAVDGAAAPMRDHPLIGELYPAHAGATSRAYFAMLPAGRRRELMYHAPLARFNDLTSDDAATIEAEMARAAQAGWAYSDGEYDRDTRAVAAPVFVDGHPVGSVSIGERKHDEFGDDIRDHVAAVLHTAARIGRALSPARGRARPQL